MGRLDDWEMRLSAYLADPAKAVFAWGQNDCALFSAGAVEAVTGVHPFPEVVGTYRNRDGAMEVLRGLGGTLFRTIDTAFPRKEPAFAQRGDLVFAQDAVGICMGAKGVFLQADNGYALLSRSDFTHAWEV